MRRWQVDRIFYSGVAISWASASNAGTAGKLLSPQLRHDIRQTAAGVPLVHGDFQKSK